MTKEERDNLKTKLYDITITPDDRLELIAYVLDGGIVDYYQPVQVSISIDDIKVIAEAIKEGIL